MKKLLLTGEIWQEGNMYTSYCPELDVASCGRTVAEARKNLLEAIDIFIEETSEMGTLHELLEEAGFESSAGVIRTPRNLVRWDNLEVALKAA